MAKVVPYLRSTAYQSIVVTSRLKIGKGVADVFEDGLGAPRTICRQLADRQGPCRSVRAMGVENVAPCSGGLRDSERMRLYAVTIPTDRQGHH